MAQDEQGGAAPRQGTPGDATQAANVTSLGQARLRQAKLCAQRQDALAEGVVALTIQGPVHGRSPFCLTQHSAASGSDGKCDVTCCPVTSTSLLRYSLPSVIVI